MWHMNSYRDLEIYQISKKLAIDIHKMSLTLPKIETYEEGSQIRRCSKSITAMIVEGFARRKYKADYTKYLIYALGECDETIVHLNFLFETGSFKDEVQYRKFKDEYDILSMKINKFIQWVDRNL
jgi:four helix bundle protein